MPGMQPVHYPWNVVSRDSDIGELPTVQALQLGDGLPPPPTPESEQEHPCKSPEETRPTPSALRGA